MVVGREDTGAVVNAGGIGGGLSLVGRRQDRGAAAQTLFWLGDPTSVHSRPNRAPGRVRRPGFKSRVC